MLKRCLRRLSIPYEYKVYSLLKNYKLVLQKVKELVKKIDPSAEVYVFGSIVTGKYTGASDIDVLVITKNIDKKYDIIVNVYKEVDAPIELHIITEEQYRRWYSRFIEKDRIVKI